MRYVITAGFIALVPRTVSARIDSVQDLLITFFELLDNAIPVLVSAALFFLLFGIVRYMMSANSPEGKSKGRTLIVWGIIALVVMVSIWSIIAILQSVFGVGGTGSVSPSSGSPGTVLPEFI